MPGKQMENNNNNNKEPMFQKSLVKIILYRLSFNLQTCLISLANDRRSQVRNVCIYLKRRDAEGNNVY